MTTQASEYSETDKYPVSIRILHWAMALTILGLIASGYYMADLPDDAPNKYDLYPLHKSFGVTVILLFFVRLVIRLKSSIPDLPKELAAWEVKASHAAHLALYVLMLAVPVSGYIMSGSYEFSSGIDFFGAKLPNIVPKDKELSGLFHSIHSYLPYLLLGIVVVHVAGALKHRYLDDEGSDVLNRML